MGAKILSCSLSFAKSKSAPTINGLNQSTKQSSYREPFRSTSRFLAVPSNAAVGLKMQCVSWQTLNSSLWTPTAAGRYHPTRWGTATRRSTYIAKSWPRFMEPATLSSFTKIPFGKTGRHLLPCYSQALPVARLEQHAGYLGPHSLHLSLLAIPNTRTRYHPSVRAMAASRL